MIITAIVSAHTGAHAKHVLKVRDPHNPETDDWNDEVSIVCSSNLGFGLDVKLGMLEMTAVASGSRCRKFLYLANINPDVCGGRELDDDEAEEAAEQLLETLGFGVEHQWMLIRHLKNGRPHFHLIANRVSPITLKAVHLGWNYPKQESVARTLEKRFGITAVMGSSSKRAQACHNIPKNERPPLRKRKHKHKVEQQAKRTKIPTSQVADDMAWAWSPAIPFGEWQTNLEERGYLLAKGDRRDLVVIDRNGGVHNPVRHLDINVAEFRKWLGQADLSALPTAKSHGKTLKKPKLQMEEEISDDVKTEPERKLSVLLHSSV